MGLFGGKKRDKSEEIDPQELRLPPLPELPKYPGEPSITDNSAEWDKNFMEKNSQYAEHLIGNLKEKKEQAVADLNEYMRTQADLERIGHIFEVMYNSFQRRIIIQTALVKELEYAEGQYNAGIKTEGNSDGKER